MLHVLLPSAAAECGYKVFNPDEEFLKQRKGVVTLTHYGIAATFEIGVAVFVYIRDACQPSFFFLPDIQKLCDIVICKSKSAWWSTYWSKWQAHSLNVFGVDRFVH